MFEELQGIQNILSTTKQELQSQRRNNTRLQNNITDAEQENLRVPDADLTIYRVSWTDIGVAEGILNVL